MDINDYIQKKRLCKQEYIELKELIDNTVGYSMEYLSCSNEFKVRLFAILQLENIDNTLDLKSYNICVDWDK